jgi:ubiquinol-cytochrome c reductase cytochrome b subunit
MTTTQQNPAPEDEFGKVGKALNELDDRLGIAKGGRSLMDKIFPDHWSFMLGEIALYSFIILLFSGVFLTFFYVPSTNVVVYHGPYVPLQGQRMSEAYASSIDLSFSVRCGLLMRQMHHWACDIFLAAMVVHMARVFFTGAFRKPRETNYVLGSTLLILGIVNGFLGYSLPDDLVSGTGIRIAFSIIESIPLVGTYIAFFLFGGNYPGPAIIPRFFIIHVLIVPVIMLGMVTVHMFLLVHQKHTQFPGKGRTENNVVGQPMVPVFAAKATGFLFMVAGATALLGGLIEINPIWQFGPYVASKISYAVQPDWYMGWLDGALRIAPAWEWTGFGYTIPLEVFVPGVVIPGIIFGIVQLWPNIERKFTGDNEMHNLLDFPRNRPKRTAFGAALFGLVAILFVASATDVIANFLHVSLEGTLWAMRILTIITPFIVYFLTYKICRELQKAPGSGKRKRANIVVRTASGEYLTEKAPERPGDGHEELAAEPVPDFLDLEDDEAPSTPNGKELPPTDESGVRHVLR